MSINNYLERTSVRSFKETRMTKKEIETITAVINNAPTSTNTQQFSAVILLDQELKNFVSKNNWNQKHIADSAAFIVFVADWTRTNYIKESRHVKSSKDMMKHEFMRVVVDATIAATYAHDALVEMGFGVTFVGGILAFGDELADMIDLPCTAFPVVGLSIGKPDKVNPIKPKMNKVFIDKYNEDATIAELKKYNEETKAYFANLKSEPFVELVASMADKNDKKSAAFNKGGKFVARKYKQFK